MASPQLTITKIHEDSPVYSGPVRKGTIYHGSTPSESLYDAQVNVETFHGSLATLPTLLEAMAKNPENNNKALKHNKFLTSVSEEYRCKGPTGNDGVIILHGKGIACSPDGIKRLKAGKNSYIDLDGNEELLEHVDKNGIEIVKIGDILAGGDRKHSFPREPYGIFIPLHRALETKPNKILKHEELYNSALFRGRAAGSAEVFAQWASLFAQSGGVLVDHDLDKEEVGRGRLLRLTEHGTITPFGIIKNFSQDYMGENFVATYNE